MASERDRDAVKVEVVTMLRNALMSASGVAGAFRRCWYRHPMFAGALFTESMRHRFGLRPDIRNITSFLAEVRAAREERSVPGFPAREAEGLIRAALGETFLLESVRPGDFSYPEIQISVLSGLFEEQRLSLAEWELLLERAQETLEQGLVLAPELALAEDEWFAAGMPDSPFAVPGFDTPVRE